MNEQKGPRPLSAAGGSVDQVVRLEAFRRRCPGVVILSPRQTGGREWLATWDEENGSTTITRSFLKALLDRLEDRFPAEA